MKKTLTLHGIIPESETRGLTLRWEEITFIAIEGIQASSFLEVLQSVLIDDFKVDLSREIPCSTVFKAIKHLNFISKVPSFMNYRNTYNNIKSFSAAILLYKLSICSLREINAALNAYTYVAKLMDETEVPLHPSLIMLILRVMGKAMSDDLLNRWLKKVANKLECTSPDYEDPMDIFNSISKQIMGKF